MKERQVILYMQKGSRNPELYENGVLKSIKRAKKKYDTETVWNVRVRVPLEWKEQIEAYVEQSQYDSINKMICDLIRKEVNPS